MWGFNDRWVGVGRYVNNVLFLSLGVGGQEFVVFFKLFVCFKYFIIIKKILNSLNLLNQHSQAPEEASYLASQSLESN